MAGLQADLDRFRDLALRSQADFENYKKRSAREKEEAIKYANSSLLERLVGIIDNFELGLAAAKEQGADSPIYSGMVLVQKQLSDLLAENGLQPIEAEGKTFDPNVHEAIAHEPSDRISRRNCGAPNPARLPIKGPFAAACESGCFQWPSKVALELLLLVLSFWLYVDLSTRRMSMSKSRI